MLAGMPWWEIAIYSPCYYTNKLTVIEVIPIWPWVCSDSLKWGSLVCVRIPRPGLGCLPWAQPFSASTGVSQCFPYMTKPFLRVHYLTYIVRTTSVTFFSTPHYIIIKVLVVLSVTVSLDDRRRLALMLVYWSSTGCIKPKGWEREHNEWHWHCTSCSLSNGIDNHQVSPIVIVSPRLLGLLFIRHYWGTLCCIHSPAATPFACTVYL